MHLELALSVFRPALSPRGLTPFLARENNN